MNPIGRPATDALIAATGSDGALTSPLTAHPLKDICRPLRPRGRRERNGESRHSAADYQGLAVAKKPHGRSLHSAPSEHKRGAACVPIDLLTGPCLGEWDWNCWQRRHWCIMGRTGQRELRATHRATKRPTDAA